MTIEVSPLDLLLDAQNPRFVHLKSREQDSIREYLLTYEDVCRLAVSINQNGGLLPGERIVVINENDRYVVVEGNRRTCALQLLLSRSLIPKKYNRTIPQITSAVQENCASIEVDVITSRETALKLMTKRHIEGVMQWKPLAKKQFFTAYFEKGLSLNELSSITGETVGKIKDQICEYKFFLSNYEKYRENHPDYNQDIMKIKIDPFLRMFHTNFTFPKEEGREQVPRDFLRINYDEKFNTISDLEHDLFEQITQLIFEKTVVEKKQHTRHNLLDIDGIIPLLEKAYTTINKGEMPSNEHLHKQANDVDAFYDHDANDVLQEGSKKVDHVKVNEPTLSNKNEQSLLNENEAISAAPQNTKKVSSSSSATRGKRNQPKHGVPAARVFFEHINGKKLDPANRDHEALICAIEELYNLSRKTCGSSKAFESFPIATGMLLRTAYEQALRLRLKQVNLWGPYLEGLNQENKAPTLSNMEAFVDKGINKPKVLPDPELVKCFDNVIKYRDREFLNANVHRPGLIRVTAEALKSIAHGGMFGLIQGILDLIE